MKKSLLILLLLFGFLAQSQTYWYYRVPKKGYKAPPDIPQNDPFIDTNFNFLAADYSFSHFYTAESTKSTNSDLGAKTLVNDSVMWFDDVIGGFDMSSSWTFPNWTRTSARRPYIYEEIFSTLYRVRAVHVENQRDPQYITGTGLNVTLPATVVALVRIKEGPDFEKWFQTGFYFDDNGNNANYSIGWVNDDDAQWAGSYGEVDKMRLYLMRADISSSGQATVSFNNVPYAGGNSITVGSQTLEELGIFSNSHHQNMALIFYGVKQGGFTTTAWNNFYSDVTSIADVDEYPLGTTAINPTLSINSSNYSFTLNYTAVSRGGGTNVPDSAKYLWYCQCFDNPFGTQIDEYMPFTDTLRGEAGRVINVDDYWPEHFPDRSSAGARVFVKMILYDTEFGYGQPHRTNWFQLIYKTPDDPTR